MSRGVVTVHKYDADEYSFILRNANVSYDTLAENDVVNFYLDVDAQKLKWLNKLAEDIHTGYIRVSSPAPEDYNDFMNALDAHNLRISGTKHTWLFGHQYLVKGHENNLHAFCKYLKVMKSHKK